MKKLLIALFISLPCHASKPIIGINDLAFAKGTGVEKVQFLMGGDAEEILGANRDTIRKALRTSMLGPYRCFASAYGGDSEKTGKLKVRFLLEESSHPSDIQIQSTDFDSPEFTSCLRDHFSKLNLILPKDGKLAVIIMPFEIKLRSNPH